MKSKLELIQTSEYWIDEFQNEIFRQVTNYMNSNNLNQKELAESLGFSKGYISQILNGDCNFTIKKIVDLSIKLGKAPILKYHTIEDYYEFEKFKISFSKNIESKFQYKIPTSNSTFVINDNTQISFDLSNSSAQSNLKDHLEILAA
jgi:transcriptional regulator with XRE-family HTH domain